MSKYIAIPTSGGPASFPGWANPSGKPPRRNSFPANNNSAPRKAPSPKAANHKKAAIAFGRKIAGKRLARQALNIHPVGRAINLAIDLYQFGEDLGYFTPPQAAQPAGFPGFSVEGECGSRGPELSWPGYDGLASRASSCFATSYDLTNKNVQGMEGAINGNVTVITTFGNIGTNWWGDRIGKIHAVYKRPALPNREPVYYSPGVPAKAPQFMPMPDHAPQATPTYGKPSPQRKPGISYNQNVRPNNLGVLELRVTGTRVRLRVNSENRPSRPGQTERKATSRSWAAFKALHRIADASTEAVDFLEVLATSTGYDGPDGAGNARAMIEHVYKNIGNFDPELFLLEFLKNEIEDRIIGRASGLVDKSSKKLGIRNPETGLAL